MDESSASQSPRPQPGGEMPGGRPQRSTMAVASVVCGVVFCCPLTSILAIALGWIALRQIQAGRGRIGGRNFARWGLLLGAMSLVIQCGGVTMVQQAVQRRFEAELRQRVTTVINLAADDHSTVDELPDSLADHFVEGSAPSPAQIEQFRLAVRDQLGELTTWSVTSQSADGALAPVYSAAGVFVFELDETTGAVQFRHVVGSSAVWPELRLLEIRIDIPDGETIVLGVADE